MVKNRDYVIRTHETVGTLNASAWNGLLAAQPQPSPFMRHEYLLALETSGCACADTGWRPHFLTLEDAQGGLLAACPLYLKTHSHGEFVFDWSWADAYARHGRDYYPKGVAAVPFTPVQGARLLARDADTRFALLQALLAFCRAQGLSSLHLLFASAPDIACARQAGLLLRHDVQFHWHNATTPYPDFDAFLATLKQEKRKKIRQERNKVAQAGVSLRCLQGPEISEQDWDFFYRCYAQTYLEHGRAPYLNRDFFTRVAQTMPKHWLLCVASRGGHDIAAGLMLVSDPAQDGQKVAWGRYWGALERVDCLHFEVCYYTPLQWCIDHGFERFEGGAQGEHKLARALLPQRTASAHWLADPAFSQAVARFLAQEGGAVGDYLDALERHTPMRLA